MGAGFLQFGAGIAQSEWGWDTWAENFVASPSGWGDQEFDAWAIGFGVYLYELYGDDLSQLTEENFTQALDDYIAENPVPYLPTP